MRHLDADLDGLGEEHVVGRKAHLLHAGRAKPIRDVAGELAVADRTRGMRLAGQHFVRLAYPGDVGQ